MSRKPFGLTAPIKEQLEAILRDYPGGQLLSEALQNAEDSGADTFVLTLDLRAHECSQTTVSGTVAGTSQPLDPRLSRPAFVLADNGRGFGEREWTSLQKLHASEKKDSPREIGRFGMGSRSYFHYADTILVKSNGEHVTQIAIFCVCNSSKPFQELSPLGEALLLRSVIALSEPLTVDFFTISTQRICRCEIDHQL
jgi:hypothetical protein